MAASVKIDFQPFGAPAGGDLVVFVGDDLKPADAALEIEPRIKDAIAGAAGPERFKGKPGTALTIPAPAGLSAERLIAVGIGGETDRGKLVYADLGAAVAGKLAGRSGMVMAALPGLAPAAEDIAQMALGARLRLYKFDRYKTKKKEDDENGGTTRITFAVADPVAARKAAKAADGLAEGVGIARDLVNEPPNVLGPEEFANRAAALAKLGVEVEVLDEKALRKLGMRALLAVGQGSARESRVVLMRWNGGKASDKPVAFVGKGVVFDSGGISIKPGGGMEDMKGDMAGAACVVGLMHALAARKARANVIGAIGLVENMPDGAAQRPGDIVTTMSGQTVEIINTDAEGRLVLADVLWHVRERYKPAFMVDLATLTGAILVALAQEYAGMFSNSDELAERLAAAGQATGEKVWRMPLGPAYDKMIDSKFADMKNAAGRHGGSITAAQFLQRFVGDTPWVHLDIAGTAMNALQTETNKSWGSGWGVRLLDRLVRDHYER
ncbi:MAG: leucyl aminopeptidase [Microvirga sp.]